MGKTRRSVRRAGSIAALAAVLLAGCGEDESPTDEAANGDEAGAETPDDDAADDEPDSDAGDDDSSEDDSAEDDGTGDADQDVETIEIKIADGDLSPPFDTYEVARGTDVRIEVTSDTADELHLHGYDLEVDVAPGEPGVLEFIADLEGRFELETHELGLQLLQLEVE